MKETAENVAKTRKIRIKLGIDIKGHELGSRKHLIHVQRVEIHTLTSPLVSPITTAHGDSPTII